MQREEDTRSSSDQKDSVNLHQVSRETFYGFVGLVNGYSKENLQQPLKINYDGRDCAVLELNLDGTARIETAIGEKIVPITSEHIRPLFNQLATEFDLKMPENWGVEEKAAAAGA